jgi:hypothetical protein
MINLKIAIFIAFFMSSIVNATQMMLPFNAKALVCHQMKMQKKDIEIPYSDTQFLYKEYLIQKTRNSAYDPVYIIKKNNIVFNKLVLKDVGDLDLTNANICEDLSNNQYVMIEDEWEQEDGDSGHGVFIIDLSKNNTKTFTRSTVNNDDYTPHKLLLKMQYLPITYTMFSKDGGLYLKVGSTYKSDIITLKKPTSVK